MTAIAFNQSNEFFPVTGGISKEATFISKKTESTLRQTNNTVSISNTPRLNLAINQILKIQRECSIDGWDGYNSSRIDDKTLGNTIEFMRALDKNIPLPELCPEPDGEIALEWFGDNRSTISISIGTDNLINYAAIFPNQHKANGTDSLKNEDKAIIELYIQKVTGIK